MPHLVAVVQRLQRGDHLGMHLIHVSTEARVVRRHLDHRDGPEE